MRKVKRYSEFGPKSTHTPEELGEALLRYSQFNDTSEIYRILYRGVDINYRDKSGRTALIIASDKGNDKVVGLLIRGVEHPLIKNKYVKGADLNIKDIRPYGMTAIMHAASSDHKRVVEMLIAAGADLTIKSDDDRTFFNFVRWDVKTMLEQAYYQKQILDKNPELYHEFVKHKIKIHPDIINDPKYAHLNTGYDLNLF